MFWTNGEANGEVWGPKRSQKKFKDQNGIHPIVWRLKWGFDLYLTSMGSQAHKHIYGNRGLAFKKNRTNARKQTYPGSPH